MIPSSFIGDLNYVLTKYKPKKYTSLAKCIEVEAIQQNSSALDEYYKITKEDTFKQRLKNDFKHYLADENIKLTSDEKAAIYLYAEGSIFCGQFINQLRTGHIGHYNCFMDFLISGMKKLKLPKQTELYRGTGPYEANIIFDFRKGQKICLDSYTSTTNDTIIATKFAAKSKYIDQSGPLDKTGGIIVINKIASNSRFLGMLAIPNEEEYLYPPMTKFEVLNTPFVLFCKKNVFDFNQCLTIDEIDLDTDISNMHRIAVVNVTEIDEQPIYIEKDNPYPDIEPSQKPTQTPKATSAPSPKSKCKGKISCKDDNNDKSKKSSKILGNFNIQNVYIGASSLFDFDFYHKIKNIIPTPHFLHPAIWIGLSNATDDSIGAVFVYGKYFPENNEPIFLYKDGAKSYTMTLKKFKENYNYFKPIKIIPQRNMKLFDFINEIKSSGKWNANNYKWTTNNCQDFIAKCINILEAIRYLPNKNDWLNLPPKLLKELKVNEKLHQN